MTTISLELRLRILKAYDRGNSTREQVASRFNVSLGLVKKLLQQRRNTGDLAPRHDRSGRKPMILDSHRMQLRALLKRQPDLTLQELRTCLGVECSLQAIHSVLVKIGLTSKNRRSKNLKRSSLSSSSKCRA